MNVYYQLRISRGPLVLSSGERENKIPQWLAAKAEKHKLAVRWMFYESALINLETTYPEKARTRQRASPKRSPPRLRVAWARSGLRAAGRLARVSGASPLTRPTPALRSGGLPRTMCHARITCGHPPGRLPSCAAQMPSPRTHPGADGRARLGEEDSDSSSRTPTINKRGAGARVA